MQNQSEKFVLWGAGMYGQCLYKYLKLNKLYNVVGVYDCDTVKLNANQLFDNLVKFQKIEDLYNSFNNGIFTAVIISIKSVDGCKQVKDILESNNIPVLLPETFFIMSDMQSTTSYAEFYFNGYKIKTCCNIYGELHEPYFCLYDAEGRILRDTYNHYEYLRNSENLYYPSFYSMGYEVDYCYEECCIMATEWVSDNYYHLVFDLLDTMNIMEEWGYKGQYLCFESAMLREYLPLLGIEKSRICWVSKYSTKVYCFKKMYRIEMADDKTNASCLLRMRDKILNQIDRLNQMTLKCYPKRIFIKRIGSRKCLGVADVIKKYEFTVIVPEELSIVEQILIFHHADIVVCPHGANSTNSLYMRSGTAFIECFGKSYIAPCCGNVIFLLKIKYRMLVEFNGYDGVKERLTYNKANDYYISPQFLENTIRELIG